MYHHIFVVLAALMFFTPLSFASSNVGEVFLSLTKNFEDIKDMPTSVSVINEEQIDNSKAKTLGEIMDGELGVSRAVYGSFGASSNASIRGSTAEQVLVLVDGRRINKISSGGVELSEIPLDGIERIEIIRGGASAVYGTNAVGGVINLITKKYSAASPVISLGISDGTYNTKEFTAGLNAARDGVSAAVEADKQASAGFRDNSDYDARSVFARLGYDLLNGGRLDLTGSLFNNELGVPGLAIDKSTLLPLTPDNYSNGNELVATTPDARQKTASNYARLEYQNAAEPGSLSASVYSSDEKLSYAVPSQFMDARYDSFVFGGEIKYLFNCGLTLGSEWWQEKYKQLDLASGLTAMDRSRVNSSGYAFYKLDINRFTFIPSFRFDSSSIFGGVFSPKLSAVYKPAGAFKISVNAGKSWRSPTFNDLFWPVDKNVFSGVTYLTIGNDALKPETGTSFDAGFEYDGDRFGSSVTFFESDITDLINWQGDYNAATNTFTYAPKNVSNARQYGTEAGLRHKISAFFAHSLSFTSVWAEDTDLKTQLVYRPRTSARYAFKFKTPFGTEAGFDVNYVSSQKTENSVIAELPEYTTINIRTSQKIKDTELWLKAENVTDKKYQTRLGYPLPGIVYMAGVTVKFWD